MKGEPKIVWPLFPLTNKISRFLQAVSWHSPSNEERNAGKGSVPNKDEHFRALCFGIVQERGILN